MRPGKCANASVPCKLLPSNAMHRLYMYIPTSLQIEPKKGEKLFMGKQRSVQQFVWPRSKLQSWQVHYITPFSHFKLILSLSLTAIDQVGPLASSIHSNMTIVLHPCLARCLLGSSGVSRRVLHLTRSCCERWRPFSLSLQVTLRFLTASIATWSSCWLESGATIL